MLADDIAAVLPELRAEAERNMQDTCIITRAGTGKGPWNESTGQYDKPPRVTVYEGKCRLQIQSVTNSASDSTAGDRATVVQGDVLQLPVAGTGEVSVNDEAEMLTCVSDGELVGHKYTVVGRHGKSQATSRRLPVKEIVA